MDAPYAYPEPLEPGIARLLARNPSPFTYFGTQTYLVGDEEYTTRLRELGFIRGEKVVLRGIAPFGEPLMIEVRGTVVALRKKEAQCIQI